MLHFCQIFGLTFVLLLSFKSVASVETTELSDSEQLYFNWFGQEKPDERQRFNAWRNGFVSVRNESFGQWRNRCSKVLMGKERIYRLRNYDPREIATLCYNPLVYRVRSRSCREIIGLMSIEGHGNHAVRWMLEQATGIISSSIYGDIAHLTALGAGLSRKNILEIGRQGRGIVVKSHKGKIKDQLAPYHSPHSHQRTIRIVRDPLGAILANYQRIGHLRKLPCSKHTVNKDKSFTEYKTHKSHVKDWDSLKRQRHFEAFARCEARSYVKRMSSGSEVPKAHPVLVIRYEDLLKKTESILRLLLAFLGVPKPPESDLECVLKVCKATKRTSFSNETDPFEAVSSARSAILSTPGMCAILKNFQYDERARQACVEGAS